MALNNYTGLVAGLQAWTEDDDSEFLASIDDIINLGELRLLRDLDLAIFRRVDTTTTMTASQSVVTKPVIAPPDVLIASKDVWLSGGGLAADAVRFVLNRDIGYCRWYASGAPDELPKYYAELDEESWFFSTAPDATYTVNVSYLSRPQALDSGNEDNWLSENAYDILFKAALAEAEKFLISDERAPVWEQDYLLHIDATKKELSGLYGNQYDRLGSVPQPTVPRSAMP
jgi:hypothetical protein